MNFMDLFKKSVAEYSQRTALVDSSYLERAIESLLTLDYFEADEN